VWPPRFLGARAPGPQDIKDPRDRKDFKDIKDREVSFLSFGSLQSFMSFCYGFSPAHQLPVASSIRTGSRVRTEDWNRSRRRISCISPQAEQTQTP